jgi:hypothetical protein
MARDIDSYQNAKYVQSPLKNVIQELLRVAEIGARNDVICNFFEEGATR